jgi:predicted ATP-grasp superfamily ATP-dependent carboligase
MPRVNRPTSTDPPIIILGSGVTALGALRAVARDGFDVYAVDTMDETLGRSRWYRLVPNAPTPANFTDESFQHWLTTLLWPRAVLIPCSDQWVQRIANLPDDLRVRFPTSVPDRSILNQFVDKGEFAALLAETETPHPESYSIDAGTDLTELPDHWFTGAILKPRDSQQFFAQFRVKAFHVDSRADAIDGLARAGNAGLEVILQRYVPGPATNHYFVDGFVDRFGTVQAIFVRQRLRMHPADFGNSTSMVSVPVEAAAGAVASITKLLRYARYRGIFSAEFKRDANDGLFKIIEVNTRAWWYVDYAARCGVNVCRMAYEDALERPVTPPPPYAIGKRMVFPSHDLSACLESQTRGKLSGLRCVCSWIGAMQPIFQFADPAPGVRSVIDNAIPFISRRLRRLVLRAS